MRQQKVWDFFVIQLKFYHAGAHWSCINLSYDLILIMEMLFMTNYSVHHFQIKLSFCILSWYKQSQESSKVAFVINCIKNYGLSISTKKDGSGNHICSKNSFQSSNNHIFILCFHKWEILTGTPILSIYFLVELNTWKTFFHMSLMNRILDPSISASSSYNIFYNVLLKFVRPIES